MKYVEYESIKSIKTRANALSKKITLNEDLNFSWVSKQ